MGAANISELGASRFASVTLTTARVGSIGRSRRAVVVLLRGRMQRVIGRVLRRVVLRDGGELDVSGLVSVNMRMSRISLMVGLRGSMKQVIGGVLQQVVLGDGGEVDSRINGRVMVHAWLELEGGMILVAARRLGERERVAHNESVLR